MERGGNKRNPKPSSGPHTFQSDHSDAGLVEFEQVGHNGQRSAVHQIPVTAHTNCEPPIVFHLLVCLRREKREREREREREKSGGEGTVWRTICSLRSRL